MEYEGLTEDDLTNVHALNRAWLQVQQREQQGARRLTDRQLDRLSGAPFLLFSLREQDDRWWQSLLGDGQQRDLLDAQPPVSRELLALQSAGLAFLWELVRRNPYVARIVSGAPLHRCEQIASATLVRVLDCAASRHMIEPRFDDTSSSQQRLLRRGGSARQEMRVFAQIGALQTMLTSINILPYRRLPAAACSMSRTAQQVADKV